MRVRYHTRFGMRIPLLLFAATLAIAHDAPPDATVHMHLRSEPGKATVLVRIPLETVRDIDFPALPGGYLDIEKLTPRLLGIAKTWTADPIELTTGSEKLGAVRVVAARISIESDRSFGDFESALLHVQGPPHANTENLFWKQVFLDTQLEYPLPAGETALGMKAAYTVLAEKVSIVLRYGGRTFLLNGGEDAFALDPRWHQAAWRFVKMGVEHILSGADHLLFLLCLVIPVRKFRELIWVVTAFTAAHSITLIASAFELAPGGLWFPPLVEVLIAISIIAAALLNILKPGGHGEARLAFGFGLVHGFGFSFALRESLQFAGSHLVSSLLAFNVGVEIGQVAAIAVMVPVLAWLFGRIDEPIGVIVLSALITHVSLLWLYERWAVLAKYPVQWMPELALLAIRWAMAGMAGYGAWWVVTKKRI
ncbi:MAG: HupE/UreJ family protein [Acidobacteria bacterium]|nr:HupE/UreJ family protein [Acidobacteriota bacterium]